MANTPTSIGVLLPTSLIYPAMGASFMAGLRLALPEGEGLRLASEQYGTSQLLAEERARKLLSWERVDLLVALASVNLASTLQSLVEQSGALCLVANLGENVPRASERHPAFVQHTLGLWQANWALGHWAAQTLGRRALFAQSFYDSGFDLPYAFRLGFEEAGGEVLHTVLTHLPPDRGNYAPLFSKAAELRPDLVFASYCGPTATQFVRAYAEAGFAAQLPLLGSGMLNDDALLADQSEAASGVITARAWPEHAATPAGRSFATLYQSRHAVPHDPFALLGFECGLLLQATLAGAGHDLDPARLAQALSAASTDGPRGPLTIDPRIASSPAGTIYLHDLRESDGALAPAVIAELQPPDEADSRFDALRQSLRSGWMNTYLSV